MDSSSYNHRRFSSPGSLYFTGEKKVESVKVTLIQFDEKGYSEREITDLNEFREIRENKKVNWLNVCGLHETEKIEQIGSYFNLHPLLLEDILNVKHAPKFDNYDEYFFIIAKMINLNSINSLNIKHICFVLSGSTVISFQEDEEDVFGHLRGRIRENVGRLRKSGADYLLYRLLDSIVDGYFIVSESIEDRIELLEDKMIYKPEVISIETIHNLRKEIVSFRRAVNPLKDVVNALQRERGKLLSNSTYYFTRDLNDHLQHTLDSLEIFRDNLKGMIDLHLSGSSRKLNEIIKVLTIISTIFIPLTFIVGVYGMNFNTSVSSWNMPELNWSFGYAAVMLFMLTMAVTLVVIFKKKKWF